MNLFWNFLRIQHDFPEERVSFYPNYSSTPELKLFYLSIRFWTSSSFLRPIMLKISDAVNYQLEGISKDIELELLHIWINSEMWLYSNSSCSIFESMPYTAEKRASARALFFQNLMPSLVFPLRNPHCTFYSLILSICHQKFISMRSEQFGTIQVTDMDNDRLSLPYDMRQNRLVTEKNY